MKLTEAARRYHEAKAAADAQYARDVAAAELARREAYERASAQFGTDQRDGGGDD